MQQVEGESVKNPRAAYNKHFGLISHTSFTEAYLKEIGVVKDSEFEELQVLFSCVRTAYQKFMEEVFGKISVERDQNYKLTEGCKNLLLERLDDRNKTNGHEKISRKYGEFLIEQADILLEKKQTTIRDYEILTSGLIDELKKRPSYDRRFLDSTSERARELYAVDTC